MRYLEQQEKTRTLPLWREAFPEDSEEFLEYYYTEKTADNRILAEEEEGRIVSMLHRNPYPVWAGSRRWNSDYVVAVATARDRRGRGLMRRLLGSALMDMFQEGMEFCFLMPADRRLYEPFGFAYVYDQPHLALTPEAERRLRRCVADDRTLPAAAAYMEEWLQNRREVRTVRDEAYVRRLAAELESENGCLERRLARSRHVCRSGRTGRTFRTAGFVEKPHACAGTFHYIACVSCLLGLRRS